MPSIHALRHAVLPAATLLLLASQVQAQSADEVPAAGAEAPLPPAAVDDMAPTDMAAPAASSGAAEILTEQTENQILTAKIVGKDVMGVTGERIAKVDDVLLDKDGRVSGLVLSAGGVLGIGGKLVAISWQELDAAEDADAISVSLTAEEIDAAPEFRTREQQQAEALRNLQSPQPAPTTAQ